MARLLSANPLTGKPRNGERPGPKVPGSEIFSAPAWREIGRSLKLSSRELQIVRAVFDDRTEAATAADLGISRHTVHTYLDRLRHKLGVTDRIQVVLVVTGEFMAWRFSPNGDPSRCPVCRRQ